MRTIGVVSVARSDYGYYLPLLNEIHEDSDLGLHLIVSGMHLSPEFGLTEEMIKADGFRIGDRVEMLLSSDSPEGISKSMGLGIIGFAQCLAKNRPDILVVLGDRFEMHAAAVAAFLFKIPLAHIHGGEVTKGAMDDALRHSITKLSHLHFVSTEIYRQRVIQMGEEPWRVFVSGAPSLDNLHTVEFLKAEQLQSRYDLSLKEPPLLVTFHPATLEHEQTERETSELLAALDASEMPVVFTLPNADIASRTVIRMIREYTEKKDLAILVDNLGTQGYFSLMKLAAAMVGNSSSGIIEAASFKLPVVNIGTRQKGRIRGGNVLDVDSDRNSILEGIRRATHPEFREGLKNMINLYGTGQGASKIVRVLKDQALNDRLMKKDFYDLPIRSQSELNS